MASYTNPSHALNTGVNVGSVNTQDQFAGYGTAFNNTDRFKLEMKKNIHMLGGSAAPFLSWASMVRKNPTSQVLYSWMEDELFTHRDMKARLVRICVANGLYIYTMRPYQGGDWQAFEGVPLADALAQDAVEVSLYSKMSNSDGSANFLPMPAGLSYGPSTYEYTAESGDVVQLSGEIVLLDDSASTDLVGGSTAMLNHQKHVFKRLAETFASTQLETILTNGTASSGTGILEGETVIADVNIHTYTPDEQLQGYAQGSGLPNETRKRSRSAHNVTQIFKTPWSIANTLKAVELYGGPELARLRLRKSIQHKTELERAILFQGGGVEGTDWGELPGTYENPLTRFKGLGVGVTDRNKAGFIATKNAEWDSRFQFAAASATMSSINTLTEAIFDDTVDAPSSSKIVFAGKKWFGALAEAALRDTGNGQFAMGMVNQSGNSLGMKIKTLESPHGDLHFVHMPLFRGQYEDYGLVVDMNNIEIRPLRGRDTTLYANVGDDTVDGQLDFMLTEMGFEARQESTHAILKLI